MYQVMLQANIGLTWINQFINILFEEEKKI